MVYSKEKSGARIKEIYSAQQIEKRIKELGETISADYKELEQQMKSLKGMLENVSEGSSMLHDAPEELLDVAARKIHKPLDKSSVLYTSGLSYYQEYDR